MLQRNLSNVGTIIYKEIRNNYGINNIIDKIMASSQFKVVEGKKNPNTWHECADKKKRR